jgi:aarF domain-containing kinase
MLEASRKELEEQVPKVIVTIPVIWLGQRQADKDDERSGTLWWYGFLVSSMERAGAAFIKV